MVILHHRDLTTSKLARIDGPVHGKWVSIYNENQVTWNEPGWSTSWQLNYHGVTILRSVIGVDKNYDLSVLLYFHAR